MTTVLPIAKAVNKLNNEVGDEDRFVSSWGIRRYTVAAIDVLADAMPSELLDKFSEWVECFEVDGEVDPLPEPQRHKGYNVQVPWYR